MHRIRTKRLSFTTQVLSGLLAGVLAGIFFGESIAGIGVAGTGYVRLLQMTILPYIMVSLVQGFGQLSREQALRVAPRLAGVMLIFWSFGLLYVILVPWTFPNRESAAFFNPSVLEEVEKMSMVDLFIPANPFQALAAGTIPAVVLFSILFGLALMEQEHKAGLLRNLDLITKTLTRVTLMVLKLTPFGIFAMTAAAAGTMDPAEFARLQVYFYAYIGSCLFLTFVAFPLITSTLTPFGAGKILRTYKASLIMAFTTGNLFVVLPVMMGESRKLLQEQYGEGDEFVDILTPVAFNFPNMGKLIALLFVLFGAWFVGNPVPPAAYPGFLVSGWVTFFGGIDLALPFMLQQMNLPADLFQLYSVSGVINGRFATLLACMELICITLMSTGLLLGKLRLHAPLIRLAVVAGCGGALLFGTRRLLDRVVPPTGEMTAQLSHMQLPGTPKMKVVPPEGEPPSGRPGLLGRLSGEKGKTLRVGYIPGSIPFAYVNAKGDLVGYEVELVMRLARDLEMNLEWYPTSLSKMEEHLRENRLDLVVSGLTLSASEIKNVSYSQPYQKLILGAVTTPKNRERLQALSPRELREAPLKVALVTPNPYLDAFHTMLPRAEFQFVDSPRDYYEAEPGVYDALLISLEAGAVWNMQYPGHSTLVLQKGALQKQLVMVAPPDNPLTLQYLDDWLQLQMGTGLMDRLYDYWFLGHPRPEEEKRLRWCIGRDVLGWWE
ncbi:cation:dicarboxylase symporter family transporter [Kiritimatiellaeota bacterium B1221]|nr:cation:dicarboxylase symporter family transporter [Kiritimatiellaeota bacterium B1221]